MRFGHLVLVLTVLGAAQARADDRAQIRTRLIDAINKHDTRVVESLVTLPLHVEKVRFSTDACRKFWGISVLVRASDLGAFVDCLASQKVTALTSTADRKADAIFGPGFPLDVGFNADGKVTALTSSSAPGTKPLLIEPSTFASHVTGFTRVIEPSKGGIKAIRAELSLCVDADGATVPVATVADPAWKSYEQDVADAARTWKIEPFKLGGKPQLACATYIVGYPETALEDAVQLTSGSANVDVKALEPLRRRGTRVILPDDATKTKIAETAAKRVIASFKLCVDDKGIPKDIKVLKPSGYDAYDQKILREMAKWAYKPYVVAGVAVPVCTVVSFIYVLEERG